jgi:ABC-type Fe3+/spermidine/putrescine transport system ATPase subunit
LQQPDLPVIYVTHDQEEAVILGDRLAILHDGLIEQTGTAQDLYNAPDSRWVAEFLGMTNFIPGEIASLNPFRIHTAAGDFAPPAPAKTQPTLGTRGTLMIKTHGVSVTPSPGKINSIKGIVRSCVFRETGYRIGIDCGLSQDLEFLLQMPFEPGSTLHLEIPPQAMVYLPK